MFFVIFYSECTGMQGMLLNPMYNGCVRRPNTGRSFYEETKTDLLNKYTHITPEEAGKTLFVSVLRL